MASVATKSLILSQPKANQTEVNSTPVLPFSTSTSESYVETRVEIPGVDPSTVSVDFEDGAIFVRCERGVLAIPVEATVNPSKIKADILWGMLTVSVPLPDPPAPRSIKVSLHDAVKATPNKSQSKFTEGE